MATRPNPFGAFNFMVKLGELGGEDQVAGGFAEVSGLESEIVYAEYRNGNDMVNHARKIPTLHRTGDVTLKRGVIGDLRLFEWLKATRDGDARPPHGGDHPARRGPSAGVRLDPAQRPAEEVGRADAEGQRRRAAGAGGAAPGRGAGRLHVPVSVAPGVGGRS